MGDQRSPARPKRQAKLSADDGFWDCSVCTFKNSAEAFKCSICDVRKGTSTRKPRLNPQLVAQQVAQQYASPPPPKKERRERSEKERRGMPEKDKHREKGTTTPTKKTTGKKTKPKSVHTGPPSERTSSKSGKSTKKSNKSLVTRPRLKNIDRSSAQQLAITVGNVTVIITDFKEKKRSSSTSSSTVTSTTGSDLQHQNSGSESTDRGSSRASTPRRDLSTGHKVSL
ncbi:RING1 and YY1-binding protein A isoform X2 [Chanos chanos]|uniref:RING1 and YY1-binding protein A isoform X2 n=1 Tax=Chanos chanos TaxID=29144 RepID=A0A6J2UW15_CHACN|nr:RING1 and YY1-binding protein B-like isoform X2 [Chanos chanos]